jgi:hypothetical protein
MENLIAFISPGASRLSPNYWLTLIAYNLSFIIPLAIAGFAIPGALAIFKPLKTNLASRFWLYNFIALFVFWTLWGKAAPAQNYYNLPNLILLSALFGLGCQSSFEWLQKKSLAPILQKTAAAIIILLLALSGVSAWLVSGAGAVVFAGVLLAIFLLDRRIVVPIRRFRGYVERIGELLGRPVAFVSVGPDRDQTIFCEPAARDSRPWPRPQSRSPATA